MKLRTWQKECVHVGLEHYESHPHFLCLATPGAGKTVMAASLAAELLKQGKVSLVITFSPSRAVVRSTKKTFRRILGNAFGRSLKSCGNSYAYQRMRFLDQEFWSLLDSEDTLVILDEIHHLAGKTLEDANAWGEEVLLKIQSKAKYTLGLTGTPWRSDNLPIVLANYADEGGKIQCDYVYGMADAVRDGSCRKPKIVLVDNEEITVTSERKKSTKTFDGFGKLLNSGLVAYQQLLNEPEAVEFMLRLGCERLAEIRQDNPHAGGLIVASSVEHARIIEAALVDSFEQTVVTVNYTKPDSQQIIDTFACSTTQWVVSIGMISEGTDIPRLQVGCFLSHVKTELYYRQVLGRMQRITQDTNQQAWLYTMAEPQLVSFAHRIAEDLPEQKKVIHRVDYSKGNTNPNRRKPQPSGDVSLNIAAKGQSNSRHDGVNLSNGSKSAASRADHVFQLLGEFRQKIIASFEYCC